MHTQTAQQQHRILTPLLHPSAQAAKGSRRQKPRHQPFFSSRADACKLKKPGASAAEGLRQQGHAVASRQPPSPWTIEPQPQLSSWRGTHQLISPLPNAEGRNLPRMQRRRPNKCGCCIHRSRQADGLCRHASLLPPLYQQARQHASCKQPALHASCTCNMCLATGPPPRDCATQPDPAA